MFAHWLDQGGQKLALSTIALIQYLRIGFYRLISPLETSGRIVRRQPVHAVGAGRLHVEENVNIGFFPSPIFLSSHAYLEARQPGAEIRIGNGTFINNGFCAIAEYSSITIGRRCLIGTNVEIIDSDFHGLEVRDRHRSTAAGCRPVRIEDDVFLRSNSRVLKGVTIGRGSVVANGSVVTRDIPPFTIVGGNPARVIRQLDSES